MALLKEVMLYDCISCTRFAGEDKEQRIFTEQAIEPTPVPIYFSTREITGEDFLCIVYRCDLR